MTLTAHAIVFDTLDARALAAWWARQLDGEIRDDYDGWFVRVVTPDGTPPLSFQKVEDPTPGKNRLHVDFAVPDLDAEVDRLLADGASEVARHDLGSFRWVVLADPDGNQFCVSS